MRVTSLTELMGGLGMISATICVILSFVLYTHAINRKQRDAAVIIGMLCVVAFLAFTGLWIVGQ